MKKFLPLVLFLIALAQCVSGQGSVQIIVQDDNTGFTKPVSAANPLPVNAEVNIGSVTVDVFPVFADAAGDPATATVDINNRAVVNIGSDSIGLIDAVDLVTAEITAAAATNTADMASLSGDIGAVKAGVDTTNEILYPPTDWQQQTITLVADTAQTIVSEIVGTRKNVMLKAQEDKPFWVSIDGDAVIGTNGTLVNSWIKLDVPLAVTVSVIASEAFAISVVESGW
jgi:hypothetical protein